MMPNPTGTTYLQANSSYVWADGDVYEIQQTDEVEGAAIGASFSGIGVDNQPHQFLLNKANYVHTKQLADEAAIAALQKLTGLITSDVGTNGWLKVGTNDVNLGQITVIVQWGFVDVTAWGPGGAFFGQQLPASIPFAFPISFPNAVFTVSPSWEVNQDFLHLTHGATNLDNTPFGIGAGLVSTSAPFTQGFVTYVNVTPYLASAPGFGNPGPVLGVTGINWMAFGY